MFRKRTFALFLGSVMLLALAATTARTFWWGLPLVFAGELVRLWSAGYLTKMEKLVTAGPFALCRNPLYIGSFLINLGYLVMVNNPVVIAIGIVVFWLFHGGAVVYEEGMLREMFGEDFESYCIRVPRFVPWPKSLKGQGEFSVGQLVRNREYRGIIGTAAVCALFGLMGYGVIPKPLELIAGLLGR